MRILCVDDEPLMLQMLEMAVKEAKPDADITAFDDQDELLEDAKSGGCDIAFLDIHMRGMNGVELAKELKAVNPKMNIIFVTGFSEYAGDAMSLHASGYIMKPVTKDKVVTEIENLRNPVEPVGRKRARARAFGSFEFYIDDKPVEFHYSKTKELLAYLIDSGAMCSNGELQENLWEDDKVTVNHGSYLQNLISDLNRTLSANKCKDIILKRYGAIGIDSTKIDCDFYEYQSGNPAAINAFRGEYMTQYPWAEKTLASMSVRI